MSIPRQELFNPKRVSRICRPNKHNVSNTSGHQLSPAEDEGPYQDLTEFSIGLH